ncbi:hypothetical protein NDU88_006120 [Pleurodeles waltl]|uniref:Uncharacterized protein n=1 Tax=Pleurodeles waltl TaxID=8319 RepID=A0AAV7SNN7_PLEWA|nr:hypothetical protein NDU88_006120 [Pleurodeles waltl]
MVTQGGLSAGGMAQSPADALPTAPWPTINQIKKHTQLMSLKRRRAAAVDRRGQLPWVPTTQLPGTRYTHIEALWGERSRKPLVGCSHAVCTWVGFKPMPRKRCPPDGTQGRY